VAARPRIKKERAMFEFKDESVISGYTPEQMDAIKRYAIMQRIKREQAQQHVSWVRAFQVNKELGEAMKDGR
jgi:hypothetical protein